MIISIRTMGLTNSNGDKVIKLTTPPYSANLDPIMAHRPPYDSIESDEEFTRIFDKFSPLLYGLILKNVQDPVEAEQILMSAFQSIKQRFDQFNPHHTRLSLWMISIVKENLRSLRNVKATSILPDHAKLQPLDLMFSYGFSVEKIAKMKNVTIDSIRENIRAGLSIIRLNS